MHLILKVACLCSSVLHLTYSFTLVRYLRSAQKQQRTLPGEPPTLPYAIPWLGSALSLIWGHHDFFVAAISQNDTQRPTRVRLGPVDAYLVTGAENVRAIFRKSKYLTFEELALYVAQKVKRCPAADVQLLKRDRSGSARLPLDLTPASERIWRQFHHIYEKHLMASDAVDDLTRRFTTEYTKLLQELPTNKWVEVRILDMLCTKMFEATTVTLVGRYVFEASPTFTKDFWEYDAAFTSLFYGFPRLFCRKGWDARDRALLAVKQYLQRAWLEVASERGDTEQEKCSFGAKLVQRREEVMENYGMSLDGRASFELGLIWSINANAVPLAAWMLIEIISRPNLLSRVREELEASVCSQPGTQKPGMSIQKLVVLPLLGSIYHECLRLRSFNVVVRQVRDPVHIDGYLLKAGNLIMSPCSPSHHDQNVWLTPDHAADEFWAERFMEANRKRHVEDGNYFPYGGGRAMCPGRFYAKQEILAAVALTVAQFDFKGQEMVRANALGTGTGPRIGSEARGVVRPDRDLRVRIKRRELV